MSSLVQTLTERICTFWSILEYYTQYNTPVSLSELPRQDDPKRRPRHSEIILCLQTAEGECKYSRFFKNIGNFEFLN